MKMLRVRDQPIAFALRQAEGGTPVEEACREADVVRRFSR